MTLVESRWFQEEAEYAALDYLYRTEPGNNPLIAMPTGTGKGFVIGKMTRNIMQRWPQQRLMMLTHVKELITQNKNKLLDVWPHAPVGIYSAGLKSRDVASPIVFGGVASVVKNIDAFGWRSMLFIDEAHLLNQDDSSMYQKVIAGLRQRNPYLRVLGLTATPYRMRQGMLTDDGLFTDICYDVTGIESFNRLIAEGYLAPLIAKPTSVEVDLSGVGMNSARDDYNAHDLEDATEQILHAAIQEILHYGANRRAWLVFAPGIKTSLEVTALLQSYGIAAACVHSKQKSTINDAHFEAYMRGELRCLVGNNKFTTGFDHPPVDLIAMLRCTLSPGLWVQMLGRGTRPFKGNVYYPGPKHNCLVLDFAGNTRRLGPINDPKLPRKPGEGGGEAPVKICPHCGIYNHATARFCGGKPHPSMEGCGFEFSFEIKYEASAGTEAVLRSDMPIVERFNVNHVFYFPHKTRASNKDTIRVQYACGLQTFSELLMLEHDGFAGKRARDWWRQRTGFDPPPTCAEALKYTNHIKQPAAIRVWLNKEYPEVLSYEF